VLTKTLLGCTLASCVAVALAAYQAGEAAGRRAAIAEAAEKERAERDSDKVNEAALRKVLRKEWAEWEAWRQWAVKRRPGMGPVAATDLQRVRELVTWKYEARGLEGREPFTEDPLLRKVNRVLDVVALSKGAAPGVRDREQVRLLGGAE
jgi:hypothetical protein